VPNRILRLSVVACFLALTGFAFAQPVPTYAWRRVTANPVDDLPGNVTTDLSGNALYCYIEWTSPNYQLHLAKISPANNVIFDSYTAYPNLTAGAEVVLSPLISGRQFAWVLGNFFNFTTSYSEPYFACYDLSSPSAPVIDGVIPAIYGNCRLAAARSDASGNLMAAVDEVNSTGGHELHFVTIDQAGFILSDTHNSDIQGITGFWSNTLGKWVISGEIVGDAHPNYSAMWGIYDPTNGNEVLSEKSPSIYNVGTDNVSHYYAINLLPGDNIGVVYNEGDHFIFNQNYFYYAIELRHADGTLWFQYPSGYNTSAIPGSAQQIAMYSATSPFYVAGGDVSRGNFVDKYDLSVQQYPLWEHTRQPVSTLYPTAEGYFGTELYTPSQNIFLEHYIDATNTYDWGRSYVGTSPGLPIPGNVAMFQNFFYVLNAVKNTGTGYDMIMERFVTGIALHDISCATSVKQGNKLSVTINLNGNVVGSPMTVALNSSSAKLLLPNGTRGQNFQVPVGQSTIVVQLTAQPVTSDVSLLLTAIQNGVRRTAPTTVTP